MPQLRILSGSETGRLIPVTGPLTIGREAPADLRLADPKTSRVHARLSPGPSGWELADQGSSNGTWQGDRRIARVILRHGDGFRLGRITMRFEEFDDPALAATDIIVPTTGTPATLLANDDDEDLLGLDPRTSSLFRAGVLDGAGAADRDQLARTAAYLALLHRMVMRSNQARNRDELFEVLDDSAAEMLEGDRCAVFLPAADARSGHGGWELWPAHARRLAARFGSVPFATTLLAAVRTRREPLLSAGGGDLDPSVSMLQAGVRSAMAAPLRLGDAPLAVLYVDRIKAGAAFTRLELEFLAAVANQLTVQLTQREHLAVTGDSASVVPAPVVVAPLPPPPTHRPSATLALLAGEDAAFVTARHLIERLAVSPLPVLVAGHAGSGRTLAARHVHAASDRRDHPLQTVSCATLGDHAGRTLFGQGDHPGVLEIAQHGTVLIEDLHLLPVPFQTRLAAMLSDGAVLRLDGTAPRPCTARLIATTTAPDRLDPSLLARMAAGTVTLPPLMERGNDVEVLTDVFLADAASRAGHPPRHLSAEARNVLLRHAWPGNVRELRDAIERADACADGPTILPDHLPPELQRPTLHATGDNAPLPLAEVERRHILHVLDHCGGNKKAAAELLGIDRSTLYVKLKAYGVM